MSAAGVAVSPSDPLVDKVVTTIRCLAEGNTPPGEQLTATKAERTDRAVTLILDIKLGWRSDVSTEASREHPKGSTSCPSEAEVQARLEAACQRTIADPATVNDLVSALRANPVEEFRTRKDGAKVRNVPDYFHWHERCGRCAGKGQHECDNLRCCRGWITCLVCNGDGRGPCNTCRSSGSVWENVPTRQGGLNLTRLTCNTCFGSGRGVYCRGGCSAGQIRCPTCRGDDCLPCTPCGSSGWFVHRYWAWLTGAVSRRSETGRGEPAAFVEAIRTLPLADIPGAQGSVAKASVTSGVGSCDIRLDCRIPHVHAGFVCADASFAVDAVGKDGSIREMPRFLDQLIAATARIVTDLGRDPEAIIAASRATRVTTDVISAVGARAEWDASTIAYRYSGAVSTALLERLHQSISRAYHALGRGPLRRTWLKGGALAIVAAVVIPFLGVAAGLLTKGEGYRTALVSPTALAVMDWGLTLLPVAITAIVASVMGRRAVRAVVGTDVVRLPDGGWLPWAAAAAVLGTHAATLTILTGSPIGHGVAFPPGVFASPPAGPLSPSSKPAIAPLPLPPERAMSGDPAVWRAQFYLAQLGFFRGAPDGSRVSPALAAARDAFVRAVPDLPESDVRALLLDLAEGAVRGRLRINTPADATVARSLGNLARAHLTRGDLDLMAAAVGRAARRPGAEEVWRSADGLRGGRVIRVVGDGGRPAPGCGLFQTEVEIGGAVDRTGVQVACQSNGRWMPRG